MKFSCNNFISLMVRVLKGSQFPIQRIPLNEDDKSIVS